MRKELEKIRKPLITDPLKIVIVYLFFGLSWIEFSDTFLHKITNDIYSYSNFQTYKGYFFIIATSILLFFLIKKYSDYRTSMQNDIVQSFTTALEFYDDYTKGHSESVSSYSIKIGKAINMDKKNLNDLYWAATMHDIGKIIVPKEILNKEGKLTDSEYQVIKKHPEIGHKILSKNDMMGNISKYVLSHHERWDGKGYPQGLKGDEIPLISQIISVADCWHAMRSKRSYKKQMSKEEAMEELLKNRGTQFPPRIVDVFIDILNAN